MNAIQKAMWLVLHRVYDWADEVDLPPGRKVLEYPCSDVEEIWDYVQINPPSCLADATNEVREAGIPAELSPPPSGRISDFTRLQRDYDYLVLAQQLPDSSWIGWVRWSGGGWNGEPAEIEWIPYAFDLHCFSEEVKTIRYHFRNDGDIHDE